MLESKTKIGVKFSREQYNALIEKRGVKGEWQSLGHALFSAWLRDEIIVEGGRVISGGMEYPYNQEHKHWHDLLETVLGDPVNRLGIISNLEWAYESSSRRKNGPHLVTPADAERDRGISQAFLALEILRAKPDPQLQAKVDALFGALRDIATQAARSSGGKKIGRK